MKRIQDWLIAALFIVLSFNAAAASATNYYVNSSCATSGNGLAPGCTGTNRAKKTISEGLALATVTDDEVHVAVGTYSGVGNTEIDFIRNVKLICDGPFGSCIVDGGGDTWAFDFDHADSHPDVDRRAELRGFKITNCDASVGAAIRISQTQPTIRNCWLTGNHAGSGGAISMIKLANPLIENCLIVDNSASEGGAIYANQIDGSLVQAEIKNCIIGRAGEPNTASAGGGALWLLGPGTITISNTRIEANTSGSKGAGIRLIGPSAQVRLANCVLAKNIVSSGNDDGGAIAILGGTNDGARARVRLMNCLVVANSARYGGGIFVGTGGQDQQYSQLEFVNSTFYGNTASATNGGHELYFAPNADTQATTSVVHNAIVWKTASTGKSVERIQGKLTIEESDVKDLSSLSGTGITLSDNIDGDPLFIDPDGTDNVLGNRDDNFRIKNSPTASPCKDNGDQTLRLEDFADLDGDSNTAELTPLDLDLYNRYLGAEVDMGSYEMDTCTTNADCGDDSNLCNGLEKCDQAHCVIDIDDCNLNGIDDFCDIVDGPSEDCDADGIPDDEVCEEGEQLAVLTLSVPEHEKSLWRDQKNIMRLTFACDAETPGSGDVLIQEMQSSGAFGSDLGSGFTFTVESGNVLKITENASTLAHRTWYAVRNTGDWAGVANFEVQYLVQRGDANNDKFVTSQDVSVIYGSPEGSVADDSRYDINGDGTRNYDDVVLANSYFSGFVAEPSGHEPP